MSARRIVVVVGGGYAGRAVAKGLDSSHEVRLVTERDAFLNNVAALRAVAREGFAASVVIPYDRLLARGRVIQGTAVVVDGHGVGLDDGTRVDGDYVVVATGSSYPFPGKPTETSQAALVARLAAAQGTVARARSVLILGAGPVGIELAGEIATAHPDKEVTVLQSGTKLLPGPYKDTLRERLTRALTDLGVRVMLDDRLPADAASGPELQPGRALTTVRGTTIDAEVVFAAYGTRPRSEALRGELGDALDDRGHLRVDSHLRVEGHPSVLAVGDVTNVAEPKQAVVAEAQAKIAIKTIKALSAGHTPTKRYTPAKLHPILVPLGPRGGAGQLPVAGGLLAGPRLVRTVKGATLFTPRYRKLLGQ